MKVLLVSANRERFPEPVFPIGPAYTASALLREGWSVRIFDAGMAWNPGPSLRREIGEFRPDFVGVSLRNVDNAAYPHTRCYLPGYVRIVAEIRAFTAVPLLLGGSGFSIFPGELMELLRAEGGVTGDGEEGLPRLLRGEKGPVVHGTLPDLSGVEFPRVSDGIPPSIDRYRTIGIQTARGCPRECAYCTYPSLEGSGMRFRPPEAVAADMEFLFRRHGKRDFFLVDSTFNADERHMAAVCRAILSAGVPARFSCYLQPGSSDPGLYRLLAEAGCVAVDFGTDTGSERMLESLRKGFTVDDIRAASEACRKAGIDFCHSLLFGGPGETEETIRETVRRMDEIGPKAVVAMAGIRIYPGTGIERIALEEGRIAAGESLLAPRFYFPEGDPDRLLRAVREAAAGRSHWFLPGRRDWSAAIAPRLLRLIPRAGPLWRNFRRSSRCR